MNKPIHITEMRKQLDIATIRKQLVNLKCWKLKTGDIIEYKGWLVKSGHWRGGTHRLIILKIGKFARCATCVSLSLWAQKSICKNGK